MVKILRELRAAGWCTYTVEIHDKHGEIVTGYHGFSVTGRCGAMDESLSGLEWRDPPCEGGARMQHLIGLDFDPDSWEGCDVILPEGTGMIVVAEQIKRAFEEAKLKNFYFNRLTEFVRLL